MTEKAVQFTLQTYNEIKELAGDSFKDMSIKHYGVSDLERTVGITAKKDGVLKTTPEFLAELEGKWDSMTDLQKEMSNRFMCNLIQIQVRPSKTVELQIGDWLSVNEFGNLDVTAEEPEIEVTPEPEPEPSKYNVTFDLDGGKAKNIKPINDVVEGTSIKLPTEIPTKDEHTFEGWLNTTDETQHKGGDNVTINDDTKFKAIWKEVEKTPEPVDPEPETPTDKPDEEKPVVTEPVEDEPKAKKGAK